MKSSLSYVLGLILCLLTSYIPYDYSTQNLARARALEFGHERAPSNKESLTEQEGVAATDGDDMVATIAEDSGNSDESGFRPRGLYVPSTPEDMTATCTQHALYSFADQFEVRMLSVTRMPERIRDG